MAKGKELQAIVEIAGKVSPSLNSSVKGATKSLGNINVKALAAGAAIGGIAIASTKAVISAGKSLIKLGTDFEAAKNKIRIGTGATGKDLKKLQKNFDNVYKSVPTTMEDASQAISDWNTKFDVSGKTLEKLTKKSLQVNKMLGEDTTSVIESSSGAFKQWGLSGKQASKEMDYIFKVSQNTGMGFSDLMNNMQSNGAVLQSLGYNFDEAAAMIANLDKAGVNTGQVLKGMKKGLGNVAKSGGDAVGKMKEYTEKIKTAKTDTEAISLATEYFGSATAVTMSQAIRTGAMDVDDLTDALEKNKETIGKCAEDTMTFSDKMQLFKQKAQVALEPLANTMLDTAEELLPVLEDLLDGLIPVIKDVVKTVKPMIKELLPKLKPILEELVPKLLEMAGTIASQLIPVLVDMVSNLIPVILDLMESLMPVIQTIIDQILPVVIDLMNQILPILVEIFQKLMPVFAELLNTIMPVIAEIIQKILPVFAEIIKKILPVISQIIQKLLPVFQQIIEKLMPIFMSIVDKILPVISEILDMIMPVLMQLVDAILPVITTLLDAITPILEVLTSLLDPILQLLTSILQPLLDLVSQILGPIIDMIGQIAELLGPLITELLEPLQPLIEGIADLISTVLGSALEGLQPVIDNIMGVFGGLIDFIAGVFTGDWERAWSGIVSIFENLVKGIGNLFIAPLNLIVDGINWLIDQLNKISFDFPDWIPVIGGEHFGLNIPHIPKIPTFAKGGFTEGVSIAGEAGTEAVISFDRRYRDDNISYWRKAGEMLGILKSRSSESSAIAGKLLKMDDFSLAGLANDNNTVIYDFSGMTYAPSVVNNGGSDDTILEQLKQHKDDFLDWLHEWLHREEETSFA